MMLRIAIVGAGWAGARQATAIRELGRKVTVACLVDNDPDHLRKTAAELEIGCTSTDYAAVLRDPSIDAVSICTPHDFHCPMALEAIAASKHVLVEKPMAMTVEDATRMIEAAERQGVKLYVAENLAYTPMANFLRELVWRGEHFGEMTSVSFASGFRALNFGYPGRRAWLTDPQAGGTGTWMLHGIHSMAQLRFIFGEVATVYMRQHTTAANERPWLEGTMTGLLTLETGVHVTVLQTSETALPHELAGYTIYGTDGTVRASARGYELFGGKDDPAPTLQPYPPSALSEYALEIESFADYVNGDSDGVTTGRSERRSLAIVVAGYESARTGQPVSITERFGPL